MGKCCVLPCVLPGGTRCEQGPAKSFRSGRIMKRRLPFSTVLWMAAAAKALATSAAQTQLPAAEYGVWTVAQVLHFTSVTFDDMNPAVLTPSKAVQDLLAKVKPSGLNSRAGES